MAQAVDVRVLDSDVGSKIYDKGPTDFVVPNAYTIKDIATKIRALAGPNPIGRLTFICHGLGMMAYGDIYPKTGERLQLSNNANKLVCRVYGGYGLGLGKEVLNLTTINDLSLLKGNFAPNGLIVIFGCAAADMGPTHTPPGGTALTGDGPTLMKRLTAVTGVSVVAAVHLQDVVTPNFMLGAVDRQPFIGPTYLFKPDGSQTLNAASY
jgi:hypothetical protein